jgi:hypothetical protein
VQQVAADEIKNPFPELNPVFIPASADKMKNTHGGAPWRYFFRVYTGAGAIAS